MTALPQCATVWLMPDELRLLSIGMAAKISGKNRTTIARMAADGRLPAIKIDGGAYVFKAADIAALVDEEAKAWQERRALAAEKASA